MITLEQAKALRAGTELFSMLNFDRKGNPQRWRVTSVKTWKTRPAEIVVKVKHGLCAYDSFNQNDLAIVSLDEAEARANSPQAKAKAAADLAKRPVYLWHKNTVIAQLRRGERWEGYLAGSSINSFHITQGWALGLPVELKDVADLEEKSAAMLLYLDRELGNRIVCWSHNKPPTYKRQR